MNFSPQEIKEAIIKEYRLRGCLQLSSVSQELEELGLKKGPYTTEAGKRALENGFIIDGTRRVIEEVAKTFLDPNSENLSLEHPDEAMAYAIIEKFREKYDYASDVILPKNLIERLFECGCGNCRDTSIILSETYRLFNIPSITVKLKYNEFPVEHLVARCRFNGVERFFDAENMSVRDENQLSVFGFILSDALYDNLALTLEANYIKIPEVVDPNFPIYSHFDPKRGLFYEKYGNGEKTLEQLIKKYRSSSHSSCLPL